MFYRGKKSQRTRVLPPEAAGGPLPTRNCPHKNRFRRAMNAMRAARAARSRALLALIFMSLFGLSLRRGSVYYKRLESVFPALPFKQLRTVASPSIADRRFSPALWRYFRELSNDRGQGGRLDSGGANWFLLTTSSETGAGPVGPGLLRGDPHLADRRGPVVRHRPSALAGAH